MNLYLDIFLRENPIEDQDVLETPSAERFLDNAKYHLAADVCI